MASFIGERHCKARLIEVIFDEFDQILHDESWKQKENRHR